MTMRSLLTLSAIAFLTAHAARANAAVAMVGESAAESRTSAFYDVRDYGAHSISEPGFGSFDSTTAIQSAVDALIAAGGGVLRLPYGTFNVSAPIDLSRTAGAKAGFVKFELRSDQATLNNVAPVPIEAVLLSATNHPQFAFTSNGSLFVAGNSRAYAGIRFKKGPAADSWAESVRITNVHVSDCTIGIDLGGAMVSVLADSDIRGCDVGVRMRAHPSDGGANADQLRSLNIYLCKVGVLVYGGNDRYPLHNNTFDQLTIQGASIAGFAAIGGTISDQALRGCHFENHIGNTQKPARLDLGDFGKPRIVTVTTSDIMIYSADVLIEKTTSIMSIFLGSHSELEEGRSTIRGSLHMPNGSIGPTAPPFYPAHFVTSDLRIDRSTIVADTFVGSAGYFYGSLIAQRNSPGPREKHSRNCIYRSRAKPAAPASMEPGEDPKLGRYWSATFAQVAGSASTNAIGFDNDAVLMPQNQGGPAYVSFWCRSSKGGARFTVQSAGSGRRMGVVLHSFRLPRANEWYFVRVSGHRNSAPVDAPQRLGLHFFPSDAAGAKLDVARPTVLFGEGGTSVDFPPWGEGTGYPQGASVSYQGQAWYSMKAENLGNTPRQPDTGWWFPVTDWWVAASMFNANASAANLLATRTWDPPRISPGGSNATVPLQVVGAELGDRVQVSAPYDLQGLLVQGYVSARDTVVVRLANLTEHAIDLPAGTWRVVITPQDED